MGGGTITEHRTCKRGHVMTEDTVYLVCRKNGKEEVRCKECHKISLEKNKDKIRERMRAWRKRNLEYLRIKKREHLRNNPEQRAAAKERHKKWMAANPHKSREYNLKHRKKNRPKCKLCGAEIPYPSSGRQYCSDKCTRRVGQIRDMERRAKMRDELYAYKMSIGCAHCGYNKSGPALDFHHPDKNKERRLTVGAWSTAANSAEISKCVLLCANCHREEHERLRRLGIKHFNGAKSLA